MKKVAILSILVLMLAVAAFNVTALSAPGSVLLGDEDERASNPDADDEEDRDWILQTSFTITNDEAGTLSNFAFNPTEKNGFTALDLNLTASFSAATLPVNQTMTVTVSGRIPEDLDAVDDDWQEEDFGVADFTITSSGNTHSGEIRMQRENQLQFKDIEICINDDDNCESADSDGDSVKDIRPGDEIILKIETENRYSDRDSEDINFDDVEVEWEIDDDDLSEDDSEEFELDAEEEHEEVWRFTLDDDLPEGDYEMEIILQGRDDHGALHGERVRIDLEVERKSHDIEIRSYSASPTTLSCGDFTTTIEARLTNLGSRDEDDVAFEVVNNELGVKERTENMELDEGRSTDVAETIRLENDVRPGRYRMSLRSFFSGTAQSDEESVEIIIPECDEVEEDEPTTTQEEQLAQQLAALQEQQARARQRVITTPSTTTESESSGIDDGWIIAIMGLGAMMLLVVLVFLVVKIFRR